MLGERVKKVSEKVKSILGIKPQRFDVGDIVHCPYYKVTGELIAIKKDPNETSKPLPPYFSILDMKTGSVINAKQAIRAEHGIYRIRKLLSVYRR